MELIEQPLKINAEIVSKTNFFMTVLAQVDIHTLLGRSEHFGAKLDADETG
jgi:hypothetical protein